MQLGLEFIDFNRLYIDFMAFMWFQAAQARPTSATQMHLSHWAVVLRKDWAKGHELVGTNDGCINAYASLA